MGLINIHKKHQGHQGFTGFTDAPGEEDGHLASFCGTTSRCFGGVEWYLVALCPNLGGGFLQPGYFKGKILMAYPQ